MYRTTDHPFYTRSLYPETFNRLLPVFHLLPHYTILDLGTDLLGREVCPFNTDKELPRPFPSLGFTDCIMTHTSTLFWCYPTMVTPKIF